MKIITKFHINSKGVPAICKAVIGKCPFGGNTGKDNHFDTLEEAQKAVDKQNETAYNLLPGMKKAGRFDIKDLKYDVTTLLDLKESEVLVTLSTGEQVKGVLKDYQNNKIEILPYGAGNEFNSILLKDEEVDYVDKLSNRENVPHSYFDYKTRLRKNEFARPEFRFNVWQMRDLSHKYVKVKYDNKEFDGKIVDFYSDGEHNSGLIIENASGEVKQIKNYRLQKLEITGDNQVDHEIKMKIDSVIYDIEDKYKDDEDYITIIPEDVFSDEFEDEYRPQGMVNDYFQLKIEEISEGNVEDKLEKYDNIDWYKIVEDNKDYYKQSKYSWDDTHGAGYDEVWNEDSEDAMEHDLEMADNAYIYFAERKDLIDDTIKEVQNIDWTSYYKTQKEGEISALKRIYDKGVISS